MYISVHARTQGCVARHVFLPAVPEAMQPLAAHLAVRSRFFDRPPLSNIDGGLTSALRPPPQDSVTAAFVLDRRTSRRPSMTPTDRQ